MSAVQIQSSGSGAGTLTIAAPITATNRTLTLPDQTGTFVTSSSTANVLVPAGTTAIAPVLLTSGTNLTSATAGAVEYDGKVIYGTPLGTQRGVMPTQQFYRLNTDLAGANATGAQSMFGVGATLSASTIYDFQIVFLLSKTAGITSHTIALGFGGTATVNNILHEMFGNTSTAINALTSANVVPINTASATVFTGALTSATSYASFLVKGTVSINAGGTFIPQYTLSAAPGGAYSTVAGSHIRIYPVGAAGAAVNVGTWA